MGEKAALLDAFRDSGLSAAAFCRQLGVPLATFALWKRDARVAGNARSEFARVAVVPAPISPGPELGDAWAGMRVLVRSVGGHEAAIEGVDGRTAVRLVALVLGRAR